MALSWLAERVYSTPTAMANTTIQVRIGYVSETDVLVEALKKLGEYVSKKLSS